MRREHYTAYKLLAPTLFVLFLVAIYPLGSTFVKSFTNDTFASSQPTTFVGFQNYAQLLSITIKHLHPRKNFRIPSHTLEMLRTQEISEEILSSLASLGLFLRKRRGDLPRHLCLCVLLYQHSGSSHRQRVNTMAF